MHRSTPHRKLPARAVAVGVASALTLAACGPGEGDAVAGLETADDQSTAATDTSLGSTIPEAAPIADGGGQEATDDAALPAPGLPVASDQAAAAPTAPPADSPAASSATGDSSAADSATGNGNTGGSATAPSSVTTMPPSSETTAAAVTQPPSTAAPTTQAPTTSPPVAANLPNLAVVDISSGASVGFPQAAQAGGLPVLLWFWSPT